MFCFPVFFFFDRVSYIPNRLQIYYISKADIEFTIFYLQLPNAEAAIPILFNAETGSQISHWQALYRVTSLGLNVFKLSI